MPAECIQNVYSGREEKGLSNFKSLLIFKNQVFGNNPHTKAVNYSTAYLTTKIMMVMKISTVMGKDHLQYASHLAVLVCTITEDII